MAFGSQAEVSKLVAALQKEQSAKPQKPAEVLGGPGGSLGTVRKSLPETGAEVAVHCQALWKPLTARARKARRISKA